MNTSRIVGMVFIALMVTASLSYAAPSCCDPNGGAAPATGAFLPMPQLGRPAVAASPQSFPMNQGAGRAVVPAVAARQPVTPGQGGLPAQGQGPSCYPSPQRMAAAPSCCPVPQRSVAAPASCCPQPGAGGVNQGQPLPRPGQFSGPGCGMGCCGGGGAVNRVSRPQTVQPIGNFTGGQVRTNVRPVPANAAAPKQDRGQYPAHGFGQAGYFGNVSPVTWSLY